MTRIRAIDLTTHYTTWRETILSSLGNYDDLGDMPWSDVRRIEIFPGCVLGESKLVIPEAWPPSGASRRLANRTIDPADGGVPDDPAAAAKRDESIRRALLAMWLPRQTRTGVRKVKPLTWISSARLLLKMAAWQWKTHPSEDGSIFLALTVADVLTGMFPAIARTKRSRDDARALFRILIDAGRRGVITDWPSIYAEPSPTHDVDQGERGRHGDAAPVPIEKTEERNWQPFSDEFVSEFIRRALWIQVNIAPTLLRCWKDLRQITAAEAARGRTSGHPSVIARRNEHLAKVEWKDASGSPILELPFAMMHPDGNGGTLASTQWPPDSTRTLNHCVGTLQALNVGMIGFCTGARSSELSAAEDDKSQASNGRLHSITFKLIDDVNGQARDWPLHPAAVRALRIQKDLADIVRRDGQSHLWVIIGKEDKIGLPLLNLTEPLVQAVEHLGLSHLTGEDRAHMHRWRHTVARLVALSVVGAPQVLLDLFGHRDLDMTLRYMLADPRIVDDAMKVAKETSFVMAEDAIAETMEGEASGPAAAKLREGLSAFGMRRGEAEFDTKTLRETAETLTFNGDYWSLVRPGVICTKGLGEYGPCTKSHRAPDPGACRTNCGHRLETSRAKQICEDALRALVDERASAAAEGAEMLLANLDGQIRAQLKRWDDVRERMLSAHPDIRPIWEGAAT